MKMKKYKKGRTVDGENFVEVDEEYDKKTKKKEMKSMKTAGIAKALKKSEKEMGYSKKPRLKPSLKWC